MKHLGTVSKALPANAFAHVPRNVFDVMSLTDIMVIIGLTLEKWFTWLFGGYLLPEGLLGDRDGDGQIDG